MSENNSERQTNGRDPKTGRFLAGNNGGGRKVGSRNRLSEAFLFDLEAEWEKSGPDCLKKMAALDPGGFVRVCANVLPAKLEQTVSIETDLFREAKTFAEAFRIARQHIGAEPLELPYTVVETDEDEPRD